MTNNLPSSIKPQHCLQAVVGFLLICLTVSPAAAADDSSTSVNPYEQGCLYRHNLTNQIRVCGTEDPPEFVAKGICRPSPFGYPEIRLLPADWESSIYESWILQIVLSELLDVPTSIETGSTSAFLNFYDPNNALDYPVTVDYERQLETAYNLSGDCNLADRSSDESSYQACGHFFPEIWRSRTAEVQAMVYEGIIQPVQALGMLGEEHWFIPKFTAERDPSLLSYLGLQGPENQQKLAERFKKPITWGKYCAELSLDGCATPDSVAQRPPSDEEEHNKFFLQGLHTGHFMATPQNNCTITPSCRGYLHDYPCSWQSPVPAQIYWMNISLDHQLDDGYKAEDTTRKLTDYADIWRAANATKSDVIFYWFSPDSLFLEFQGTDAEFTRVLMPAPTQACMNERVVSADHCNPDLSIRHGSTPTGICQEPPNQIGSLMSSTVFHQSYAGEDPAVHSPAHAALSSFRISELQIEDIFSLWSSSESRDEREAVCQWVTENLDYVKTFIPRSYPRKVEQKDEKTPLMYSSTIVGSFVAFSVIIVAILVHEHIDKRAIKYAQVEFLDLLLLGSLFIAVGAVTIGAPSTSASCILEIWFINLGYTLELAPLIVKTAGITHVIGSGKRMKRIKISRYLLFGIVMFIGILMVVFLLLWTIQDPPRVQPEYELTADVKDGETLVWVVNVCRSESMMWSYAAVGWNAGLLLVTSAYALKMRKIDMVGFNETSTLALMVYSHSVFVVLRVITYLLSSSVSDYVLAHCRSLIFSVDTMATIFIYFLPKFLAPEIAGDSSRIHIRTDSWYSNPSGSNTTLLGSNAFGPDRRTSKEHVAAMLRQQQQHQQCQQQQQLQKEDQPTSTSDISCLTELRRSVEKPGTGESAAVVGRDDHDDEDKRSTSDTSEMGPSAVGAAPDDAAAGVNEIFADSEERGSTTRAPSSHHCRRNAVSSMRKGVRGSSSRRSIRSTSSESIGSQGQSSKSGILRGGNSSGRLFGLHKTLSSLKWIVIEEVSTGDLDDDSSDEEGSIGLSELRDATRRGGGGDRSSDAESISLLKRENECLKERIAELERKAVDFKAELRDFSLPSDLRQT